MRPSRLPLALLFCASAFAANYPEPVKGDFLLRDYKFVSGQTLSELRLHYTTIGTLRKDAAGKVTNAVIIMHGTGGSGRGFLSATFADVLFKPGGLLDASRYFIILPDAIGHGQSSKPSDGLRLQFPNYRYEDVTVQPPLSPE